MTAESLAELSSQQLDKVLQPITVASHAPGAIYTSDEILQMEKSKIFMQEWLCVARTEEIENPGDYLTTRIIGEPILIVRNSSGVVNAFANVCLHRGVEIATGNGNAQQFTCPYHAWAYDLNGNLTSASFMRESKDFNPRSCKLKTIHTAVWAGWVFISFAEHPMPFEDAAAEFTSDVDLLKMENLRLGSKITLDLPTNWKFVVENLMDVYHVRTLHYNSFGKHRGPPENYPFHLRKNGGTCTRYEARPMTPDGVSLFGKMPALEQEPENFAMSAHFAPNMQVIARVDNVHPLVMWPVTATTSRTFVYNLYPTEWFDQPGFQEKIKVYDEYMRLVLSEDVSMMNSLQNGVTAANYSPGRFSTLEKGIHHVLNDYIAKISV